MKINSNIIYSHQRLLFTLLHNFNINLQEIPTEYLLLLSVEINKIIDEEISARNNLLSLYKIRDISNVVKLPENNFNEIGKKVKNKFNNCNVCFLFCAYSHNI